MCSSCTHDWGYTILPSADRTPVLFSIDENGLDTCPVPELKGTVTTFSNLFPVYVSAYTASDGILYFGSVEIGTSSLVGAGEYDSGYMWPDNSLKFIATNADFRTSRLVSDFSFNPETSVCTFDCHLVDTLYSNDARHLHDYVFAMTPDKSEADGVVPLDFHHCFSSVAFKINVFPYETNRLVKSVSVLNVQSVATCSFGPDMNFNWHCYTDEFVSYRQAINLPVPDGSLITEGENVFMMIPQELSSEAAISVVFYMHDTQQHGHEMIVTYKIAQLTPQWLPGKRYVYAISYDGQCTCEQN
jgi:hypothetical protein